MNPSPPTGYPSAQTRDDSVSPDRSSNGTTTSEASSAAERRLRTIIDAAPVGLLAADPSGKVLAMNRAGLALHGDRQLSNVLQTPYAGLVAPDSRDRWSEHVTQLPAGEITSLRYDVLLPDGTSRSVQGRSVELRRDGTPTGVLLHAMWHCPIQEGDWDHDDRAECDRLRAQQITDVATIESLREELTRARAVIEQVEALRVEDQEEAQAAVDQLAVERDSLAVLVSSLRHDLEEAHRAAVQLDDLARERDEARATCRRLADELETLGGTVDQLRSEIDSRAGAEEKSRALLATQCDQVGRLEAALNEARVSFETRLTEETARSWRLNDELQELISTLEKTRWQRDTARDTLSEVARVAREAGERLERAHSDAQSQTSPMVATPDSLEHILCDEPSADAGSWDM